MLRSRGIPSRVVVGYRTEEWNEVGGFFQIRQLHAHTWVEARFARRDIPPDVVANRAEWTDAREGWLRLDPTAGTGPAAVSVTEGVLSPITSFLDRMEFLWDNYVMEMDQGRQSRAIYKPLKDWGNTVLEHLRDPRRWGDLAATARRALNPANWNIEQWFSWRGGVAAVVACFVFVGLYHVFRVLKARLTRNLRRRRQAQRAAARAAQVEFYRRFEMLMAKRKFSRETTTTHREFARRIAQVLDGETGRTDAGAPAREVTEAFYRVRFAHRPLEPAERARIAAALSDLERTVARGGEGPA
jgi:hypothetical protein